MGNLKDIDWHSNTKDKIDWNPPDKTCIACGSCLDDGFCECCDKYMEEG